jgi:hypothetical protein
VPLTSEVPNGPAGPVIVTASRCRCNSNSDETCTCCYDLAHGSIRVVGPAEVPGQDLSRARFNGKSGRTARRNEVIRVVTTPMALPRIAAPGLRPGYQQQQAVPNRSCLHPPADRIPTSSCRTGATFGYSWRCFGIETPDDPKITQTLSLERDRALPISVHLPKPDNSSFFIVR